ncbi:MAG TPA: dephospho-CoA kinase, partial [Giesbergeria sp.]|nr:dephospho-CoA kinase [Giesbergeria sp.]
MTAPRSSAWQVGLTGGTGSGKSTVAAMLAACGATVVDADQ